MDKSQHSRKRRAKEEDRDRSPHRKGNKSLQSFRAEKVVTAPPKYIKPKLGYSKQAPVKFKFAPVELVSESESSDDESDSSDANDQWEPEDQKRARRTFYADLPPYPPKLTHPPVTEAHIPEHLDRFNLQWLLQDRADRENIRPDKFCVFYGKRGSGKTFGMRNILWQLAPFVEKAMVFTNTKQNQYWQQYLPKNVVIDPFDPQRLEAWVRKKKAFINKWEQTKWMQQLINPYDVLILEDCVDANNLMHAQALTTLAANGRHLRTFVMISTQYPKKLGPIIRDNVDYAFVYFLASTNAKKAIVEQYFSELKETGYSERQILNFISQQTVVDEQDKIYNVLVVDQVRATAEMDKRLYGVNFVDPGPFKFGSVEFWQGAQ